ncbi:bile acid:sodium symporter [Ruficoccus sp. ZRK36]|uniref:bile acid:sodium symporter n=1 Tax=Ruficoccus sp. ZRK36 TaxID=2866311 RepID=UPI001C736CE9|nr:bile acid:sodium symporter [Ruficoccus sp. ZRK36]QYY35953.1 bile acid:sodium symporter [Ruficoccus sp. ZRK36]
MSVKKAFLPAGLLLAIIVALLLPGPGIAMQRAHMIAAFVIVIFLVNGWEFKISDTRLNRSFLLSFGAVSIISLLLGPWIGLGISRLFGTEPGLAMGLIIMSAVPVTLSSAIVMSEISGGNRAWALLMTIGLNLLGIFTVPYMLEFTLQASGDINFSPTALLTKLVGLVLLPFLAGFGLRRLIGSRVGRIPMLGYLPSTCVILTVYAAFAVSRDMLGGIPAASYPLIGGAALSIHLALMAVALGAAWLLKLARAERHTVLFVTSQKTLPVAVSVIALIAADSAVAMVPCLLFHFIQLFFDSFVASHLAPASASPKDAKASCNCGQ